MKSASKNSPIKTILVLILTIASPLLAKTVILQSPDADYAQRLAAKELRRYIYLRTGDLLDITQKADRDTSIIFASYHHDPKTGQILPDHIYSSQPQSFQFITQTLNRQKRFFILANDPAGLLYGTYAWIEQQLGVGFYLHGDTIPDQPISLSELSNLNGTHQPYFQTRGILPFHDFPEGPDWWTRNEWKTFVEQLAKLRMNIVAMHCYPSPSLGPEPLVWIGLPEDSNPDGTVNIADRTGWHNTLRWAAYGLYWPMPTSNFHMGADRLFANDVHGPDTMDIDDMPFPDNNEDACKIFNRVGRMMDDIFSYGKKMGMKTCIGTEAPLYRPPVLHDHLREKTGLELDAPELTRILYRGLFERITKTHPLDYYWLWTPEGWTWEGADQDQIDKTARDITIAQEVLEDMGNPITLATCGWVLGPPSDRSLFDKILNPRSPMTCISRSVGKEFVEPAFSEIEGRPQWAIPWFEDDPAMVSPQLWAGRMRRDASDAHQYGCTGLLGLHWRTRILSPNISALAKAAWDQKLMAYKDPQPEKTGEVKGGTAAFFDKNTPVAKTDLDPVYLDVRYGMDFYQLEIANGTYDVTLQFAEPHHNETGKRIFDVSIQGQKVIEALDILDSVGKNTALDRTFNDIRVENGKLRIDFQQQKEYPCIAGIVIDGMSDPFNQFPAKPLVRKINCGGPAWQDYEADVPQINQRPRDLPADDFYREWANKLFGPEAAEEIADIFVSIDGRMPQSSTWVRGPGVIAVDKTPWDQRQKEYAFIDRLEPLRSRIHGPASRQRFDYWLHTFQYARAQHKLACTRHQLDLIMQQIDQEPDEEKQKTFALEKALPVRVEMGQAAKEMYKHLLASVTNSSELGTIANIEQQSLYQQGAVNKYDRKIMDLTFRPIPIEGQLSREYHGPTRIIVPAKRTQLEPGEDLMLDVIILSREKIIEPMLYWKPLAANSYSSMPLGHIARSTYRVTLNASALTADFEYYIQVNTKADGPMYYPAAAPKRNHTVILPHAKE